MSTLVPDHAAFIPIMPWGCLRAPLPLSIALIEAPASVRVGAILPAVPKTRSGNHRFLDYGSGRDGSQRLLAGPWRAPSRHLQHLAFSSWHGPASAAQAGTCALRMAPSGWLELVPGKGSLAWSLATSESLALPVRLPGQARVPLILARSWGTRSQAPLLT